MMAICFSAACLQRLSSATARSFPSDATSTRSLGMRRCRRAELRSFVQRVALGGCQLTHRTARQCARQLDRAETDAHETAHGTARRLPQAAHFAVAALAQAHTIPAVAALTAFFDE